MDDHNQKLAEFFMSYHAEQAARALRGERVLIAAGVLRNLSAAHGASSLTDLRGGWEQDGDVIVLGDWESLPADAPAIELTHYG